MNSPNQIGTLVDHLREERGISYRGLSDSAAIPLATLHRRINADEWKVSELARVATALGTTPSALLSEAERQGAA